MHEDPPPDVNRLWVDQKPDGRRIGPHPIYYAGIGVLMALILLALVAFDAITVLLGQSDGGLGAPYSLVGFAEVAGYAVILAFVGVLWPIGFLSQAVLLFSVSSRSRTAPKAVSVARVTHAVRLGPTFDPLVQTPRTRRWNAIGNLGWLPNVRIIIGAWGIALALSIVGFFHRWYQEGASLTLLIVALVVFAAIGIALLTWGIRARFAKLATEDIRRAHAANAEQRAQHRDEQRRARLTPEERAAEDTQLANLIPSSLDRAGHKDQRAECD